MARGVNTKANGIDFRANRFEEFLKLIPQNLTDAEKAQVLENIGAIGEYDTLMTINGTGVKKGDAVTTAETAIVVDGEMSDSSQNPAQNKVVKAYVDGSQKEMENIIFDWSGFVRGGISVDTGEILTQYGDIRIASSFIPLKDGVNSIKIGSSLVPAFYNGKVQAYLDCNFVGSVNATFENGAVILSADLDEFNQVRIPLKHADGTTAITDDELASSSIRGNISLYDDKFKAVPIPMLEGYSYDLLSYADRKYPQVNTLGFHCCRYPVHEGDVVIINGTGGVNTRLLALIDGNDSIVYKAAANATENNLRITIPSGITTIIINDKTDATSYIIFADGVKHNTFGKTISFVGDSVTSFNKYLASNIYEYSGATYETYYPQGDVTKVKDTWWMQVIDKCYLKLGVNCSWSGSRVVGESTSTSSAACASSTKRISDLGLAGTPDIIVCFMGLNDLQSTYNETIGDVTSKTPWQEDVDATTISQAYAMMLSKILTAYPLAKVFCCTMFASKASVRDVDGEYPVVNSNGLYMEDVNDRIKNIANGYGVKVIDLNKCGIHFGNIEDMTVDGVTHPNKLGHKLIAEMVAKEILDSF